MSNELKPLTKQALAARRRTPEWQQHLFRLCTEALKKIPPEKRSAAARTAALAKWAKMSPEQRSENNRHAVLARWAQVRAAQAGNSENVVS